MRKNSCRLFYCVYLIVFSFIFFASQSMQAQSKAALNSQTEYAIETRGGKETEIKRHYQAFDQQGNLIDEIDYDSEGKLKEQTKYEYNQKNEKVKETHFADNGKIDEISTYEYDGKGNRISKTVTDENGKLKSKKKYVYEYY